MQTIRRASGSTRIRGVDRSTHRRANGRTSASRETNLYTSSGKHSASGIAGVSQALERRSVLLGTTAMGIGAGHCMAASPGLTEANLPLVTRAEVCPGLDVSTVVKGCWQLSGGHKGEKKTDRTSGRSAIEDFDAFVNAGVTTFDTADIYGPSEELIGEYLKQHNGPEIQVFTKYCCFGRTQYDISENYVNKGINNSRKRLNMDKLDLVQLYWHDYKVKNYVQAAQILQANPSVRNVGVTNFDVPHMEELIAGGVTPVLNQVQYSILDRRPENGMIDFCNKHNIKILPYGVLAGGFLSEAYLDTPASSIKVDTYSKSKYASVISQLGGWNWFQELLQVLHQVAIKHKTTIANIACKWVLDKPQVVAILVGARNADHVADHQSLSLISLDDTDKADINAVLSKGTQAQGDCYTWERGGIF